MTDEARSVDPADAFGVGGHGWDAETLRAVSPRQHAAREVAAGLRRLAVSLETTGASIAELDALAARLGELADELPDGTASAPASGSPEDPTFVYQAHRLRERSPFIGRANPVALPLEMTFGDGTVEARPTFGTLYEGPPGCLHGGYIAGIFDEALGAAQSFAGQAGMTGRLTIHYRSPTPLRTELHLRAWLESVNGRKVVCKGTLHAGDRLCAEADGLFITVDPSRFMDPTRR
ncbi:MAG: PaaI family thioesterase [Acidimicrobiia bacterium]|nr:PaaI family thioesterase [Acidimicrobiia bacterium]